MQYNISNDILTATIDTLGAEVVSLVKHNKQLLWQNQTGSWSGHAPILFPFCGNCQIWVDGVHYPNAKHGFARKMQFELVTVKQNCATFVLRHNLDTAKLFPFEFDFYVTYTLQANTLCINYTVQNLGERTLYFYSGGHEAQYLDKELCNYHLVFDKKESFDALLDDNGVLNGKSKSLGYGNVLQIPMDMLSNSGSVILGNINSRKVTLLDNCEKQILSTTFNGFCHLLLWSPDGYRALCIEPWQNLPDSNQISTTELSQKQRIQIVPAGKKVSLDRAITYFD